MRALILAALIASAASTLAAQTATGLHIQVQLAAADGSAIPLRGVVLLVSDNPPSGEPRRVVTGADGSITLNLRPGNYTVESDRPAAFDGKAYEWTQLIDVVAGRQVTLALTAANADIGAISASAKPVEGGSIALFAPREASVVEVWSPTAHAAGFLADPGGLIVTTQRVVGDATAVEVQVTPAIKVAGRVMSADKARDVAIVWIDPAVVAAIAPLTITCAAATPRPAAGSDVFAITIPMLGRKDMTWGATSDLRIARGASGGPVFAPDGTLIGLTTDGDLERELRAPARVIPINYVCDPLAAAQKKMQGETAPAATLLPVEPKVKATVQGTMGLASRAAATTGPPKVEASDFDITLFPPMRVVEQRGQSTPSLEFANWYDYVMQAPSLLFVRVTPKFEEPKLMTLARGAAMTQGMALPPIKKFKANFLRMQAFCGDAEVIPIHPFIIEQSIDEKQSVKEGFYVFDPAALGPQCSSVKFMLYSAKEPDKGDAKTIEPSLLKQ